MLFSTKAEYGVRLMVELGRQRRRRRRAGRRSSAVAEAESLPLSYLEHLVAKLRKAGLVDSTRGAHGGYRLARPAERDRDARRWSRRSRARSRRWSASTTDPEGRVLCSHETDGDRACATKLLWTRVQGGVTKALAGHHAGRAGRVRRRPRRRRASRVGSAA